MSDKRKRKQDKREKKKGKGGGGGRPKDPQAELEQHLDRFMELALEHEALDEFGFDPEAFLPAALGRGGGVNVVPPGGDLADVVVPRLAGAEAAAALREALAGAHEVFQAERRPQRDMLALFAAIAVAEDAVESGAEEDHPLWALAFDCTFARALGGGGLLAAALDAPARRPSKEAVAALYAKTLEADAELRASLGANPPSADELASWLLETLDDPELLPALPPEVVLHGLLATHRVATDLGQRLGKEGPTPAIVRDLEELAAAAYAQDPVGELAPAIARDVADALKAEGSGEERAPLQAMLVALRAWPAAESPFLKLAWGTSIGAPAVADQEEEELAGAVWSDPDDASALAALEAHLKESAPNRAARVARFRETKSAPPPASS